MSDDVNSTVNNAVNKKDAFILQKHSEGLSYREIAEEGKKAGYEFSHVYARNVVKKQEGVNRKDVNQEPEEEDGVNSKEKGEVRSISQLKDLVSEQVRKLENEIRSNEQATNQKFEAIMQKLGVNEVKKTETLQTEMPAFEIPVKLGAHQITEFEAWKAKYGFDGSISDFLADTFEYFMKAKGVSIVYTEKKVISQ